MELADDLYGSVLVGVRELVWDNGETPARRQAICLDLGLRSILIIEVPETSEVRVSMGDLETSEPEHRIRDVSSSPPFSSYIGRSLREWWFGKNSRGYDDLFVVALGHDRALCFVGVNRISVLEVAGEQLA